ncbi:hypothetical protein COU38_03525 [Candidatus Micrarchaeota archaeon CG10_big_fil_rev_8_21_14_0_10_54_18]|nr:MAG: hypothetical protein AUJ15_00900 [Candidatus Micrarchaeota archaeon CG1_02_55_41]PJD00974.1 MAG: hypothetical protein COU38_03525 [Candidatus Micrarchaeota archaeon CG10_big_fil_rev_8_21_14_0_10_54_18]
MVLNVNDRKRILKPVLKKGSIKRFCRKYGLNYDCIRLWIGTGKKIRQPTAAGLQKLENILDIKTKKRIFQVNNSRRIVSDKNVMLTEDACIAIGLFLSEGQKTTNKKITFTNTSEKAVLFFKKFLKQTLHVKTNRIKIYVYHPRRSPNKARNYVNKKSSKTCFIVCAYDCFAKRVLNKLIGELESPTSEEARGLLQGLLYGDGNLDFSDSRKHYEISMALGKKECKIAEKTLKKLGINYKKKTKNKVEIISIHKKSNFVKVWRAGGFGKFEEAKNDRLKKAISNYTYSR